MAEVKVNGQLGLRNTFLSPERHYMAYSQLTASHRLSMSQQGSSSVSDQGQEHISRGSCHSAGMSEGVPAGLPLTCDLLG